MSSSRDINQSNRLLSFEDNKAFDLLIPTHFIGTEGLSELFSFAISGYCRDSDLRLETLLDSAVTLKIKDAIPERQERYFHGYVAKVEHFSLTAHKHRRFRITLKPKLWFLGKVQVCAIYHNQSIPELVKSILNEQGIHNVDARGIKQNYPPREYTAQYNESVLNFVLRLLEETGIHYYFSHDKHKHNLILLDNLHSLPGLQGNTESGSYDYSNTQQEGVHIHNWQRQINLVSKSVSLNDYNYQDPTANLVTTMKSHGVKLAAGMTNPDLALEVYEYANGTDGRVLTLGQRHSSDRLNQLQNKQEVNLGSGNAMNFSGGYQFQFKHPEDGSQSGQYRITHIQHQAHDHSHIAHDAEGGHLDLPEPFHLHPVWGNEAAAEKHVSLPKPFDTPKPKDEPTQSYQNHFHCTSGLTRYNPSRRYQKPKIHGHHHAIVTGPKGNAIYTDMHGRIKVTFPWDENKDTNHPESNSSWIRVLQNQSGEGWGMNFLPRVGHEVLIGYQEGDIDRPICFGSCYNETQQPAYTLPEAQHLSGIKTRTTGSDDTEQGHEIQFNDLPGKEHLTIKAQNQLTESISHDAHHSIGKGFTEKVQGNKTISIKGAAGFESPKSITLLAGGGQIRIDPNKITIEGQTIRMGELGSVAVPNTGAGELAANGNSAKDIEQLMYPSIEEEFKKILKKDIRAYQDNIVTTSLSVSGAFSLVNEYKINPLSVSHSDLKMKGEMVLGEFFSGIKIEGKDLEKHEVTIGGQSIEKNYTIELTPSIITPLLSIFKNDIVIQLVNKKSKGWIINGTTTFTVEIKIERRPNSEAPVSGFTKLRKEYLSHFRLDLMYIDLASIIMTKMQAGPITSKLSFLRDLSPVESEVIDSAMILIK